MAARISKAEARRLGIGKPMSNKADDAPKSNGGRAPVPSECDKAEVSFEIPVKPQAKHRPRTFVDEHSVKKALQAAKGSVEVFMRHVRMKTVTTKVTRDFEQLAASFAAHAMKGSEAFKRPVIVSLTFRIPGDPDTWPTSQKDGDLDNHEKAVLDALNGIVYADDKQIVRKYSEKVCCAGDGSIAITVREL